MDRSPIESYLSPEWRRKFMGLALHISSWSKDPSSRHGAVIIEPGRRTIRGTGYNGFPRGVDDDPERYAERSVKYKLISHAESNAIHQSHGPVVDCIMICTGHPCVECSKHVIQAGILEVICPPLGEPRFEGDWQEDARNFGQQMLREAGVYVTYEQAP